MKSKIQVLMGSADDGIHQLHAAHLERAIYPHAQTGDYHVEPVHVLHLGTDSKPLQYFLMPTKKKLSLYM